MKKLSFFVALVTAALFASCSDNNDETPASAGIISGRIVEVNDYGQPIPNFTPADMKRVGFDYGDLLEVTIGNNIRLEHLPYVSSFNEVAILGPSYVDYLAHGDDYGFAMLNGDFHYYIGGEVGDTVVMKLQEKGGYKKTYELMKSVYQIERQADETAEQYANFRMINTTGIASGVIYRSSNPLNCDKNPGRYVVVDSLAREVGIKTEIDLADTPEKVRTYMASEGYASTYCPKLFNEGRTIACGMMANTFHKDFKAKMGEAVRFMIANEPPYLIHCNEGKDRCGFVSMVLEAFAGASVDELCRDYMVTMLNFYHIPDNGESYNLRQSLSVNRMLWLLCHEDALNDYASIDWDYKLSSLEGQVQPAAEKYLKECGLTDSECQQLREILSGKK